jgi:multidrug resistance efflux pump
MVDIARAPKPKTRGYVAYGGGVVALIVVTVALSRLQPAAPTVERSIVSIDSVRQGDMVREVRGPGTLVPEHVRWIPAVVSGRVDHIAAQVGQQVTPETILLEMSNPDEDIRAMQAQQALSAARVALGNLRVSLQTGLLNSQAAVASARTAMVTATQEARVAEDLLKEKLISSFEYNARKAAADEAMTRHSVAVQQSELLKASIDSQVSAQAQEVERLRQIAAYRESQKASLTLRAGDSGVLQELAIGGRLIKPGQWVNQGQSVAKVVQPGKLKAVIRIPETQAKDVAVGQEAVVDTRNGLVKGHVSRIDPASSAGTVTVDLALDGALPAGARPDLNVDGTIQIQRLRNIVFTGRPAYGQDGATIGMFRLSNDEKEAIRVRVQLGVSSVNAVQIIRGLKPGDRVILSDMTQYDSTDRVRIK